MEGGLQEASVELSPLPEWGKIHPWDILVIGKAALRARDRHVHGY